MAKLFNVVYLLLHLLFRVQEVYFLLLIRLKFLFHCFMLLLLVLERHHKLVLFTHVPLKALNVLSLCYDRLNQLLDVVLHRRFLQLRFFTIHELVDELLTDLMLLVVFIADGGNYL